MKSASFEELFIWQEARLVVKEIYLGLGEVKDFGFRDQCQRAGVSIMNNIAEGFERNSNKEFCVFLKYAKGSCGEVKSMSYLAEDLHYLTSDQTETIRSRCKKIASGINTLQKYLQSHA